METFDPQPEFHVQDAEYLRLLGYPRGHEPGGQVLELMAWAREWYARHGRPWTYHRRVALQAGGGTLWLDDVEFASPRLQEHFQQHAATGAVLVAMSEERECEEHARELRQFPRPPLQLVTGREAQQPLVFRLLDTDFGMAVNQLAHGGPAVQLAELSIAVEDSTGLNWQPSTK